MGGWGARTCCSTTCGIATSWPAAAAACTAAAAAAALTPGIQSYKLLLVEAGAAGAGRSRFGLDDDIGQREKRERQRQREKATWTRRCDERRESERMTRSFAPGWLILH